MRMLKRALTAPGTIAICAMAAFIASVQPVAAESYARLACDCDGPVYYGHDYDRYDGRYRRARYDDRYDRDYYPSRYDGYDGYRGYVCDSDGDRCYRSSGSYWNYREYYRRHGYRWND